MCYIKAPIVPVIGQVLHQENQNKNLCPTIAEVCIDWHCKYSAKNAELMADTLNAKSLAAIDKHVKEDNKNNNKFLDATPGVAFMASELN